jgi:hypothetical protein
VSRGSWRFQILTDTTGATYIHRLASATGAGTALKWFARSDPCNSTWLGVNYDGNMRMVGLDVHGWGIGGWVPELKGLNLHDNAFTSSGEAKAN